MGHNTTQKENDGLCAFNDPGLLVFTRLHFFSSRTLLSLLINHFLFDKLKVFLLTAITKILYY